MTYMYHLREHISSDGWLYPIAGMLEIKYKSKRIDTVSL